MELKELTGKICELFGCSSAQDLPQKVKEALQSEHRNEIFEKYKELCPDLTVDWMQRVYQFYLADREGKKQDYTPVALAKMVAELTKTSNEHTIYDCCCGSGALTIQKWCANPELKFVCEELDEQVLPILLFNLCIRNIEAQVVNKDILSGEVFNVYHVKKGDVYADIVKMNEDADVLWSVDAAVSNPPFNLKVEVNDSIREGGPEKMSCNYAFVTHCMQRADRCAIILPQGVLSSKIEMECRRYFVEKGWLQAVIQLPDNIFESTSVATCILVLDKRKTVSSVMMIDATMTCTQEVRSQRGEGDASHYNRIYKKTFNTFTEQQISDVVRMTMCENGEVARCVGLAEIQERNYDLAPGRYKPLNVQAQPHRDINEIIKDMNRVIRERNIVKVTVNKVWAERLDLTSLIQCNEENREIVKALNDGLDGLKNYEVSEKILDNKYIQSSNSKVFMIENADKEMLSTIMLMFMPMWKQHIMYLNLEENRLLAELRDAMMAGLFSGEIEIKTEE